MLFVIYLFINLYDSFIIDMFFSYDFLFINLIINLLIFMLI